MSYSSQNGAYAGGSAGLHSPKPMPVQFPCERCRTRLSIARRKIGTQINCPRCGQGMRVPTESEAKSRMLLAQVAGSRPSQPAEDLRFSEFAVFDDDDSDDGAPCSGVLTPSQLPVPPLMPSEPAPLERVPSEPVQADPAPPPAPPVQVPPVSAPPPPPVATAPPAAVPPPPPIVIAPTNQPPADEQQLPPLVMVPEDEETATSAPEPAKPPADELPPLELPLETPEPSQPAAEPEPQRSQQPEQYRKEPSASESFWADPVAPPVKRSVPPVPAAPPVQSAPVKPPPVASVSTLTGRAASVIARQKAVKPVPGGWLLVPRRTIFLQAGLIVIVGLLSFVAGWLAAGGNSDKATGEQPAETASIETVLVQGTITYRTPEGRIEADEGAVVLVWPRDAAAEPRIDPKELHPSQPAPNDGSRAMLGLEEIGAKHVRTLSDGTFNLVVPRQGEYYVLVVSRHTVRPADESVDGQTINVLRRIFVPAATGIDRQRYRLTLETFDSGLETYSHDFDRSGA